MRKKWMRAAAAMLMSALMLTTPACAAAPEETPAESAPQAEIVREGGLAYVPDRSVYFADVNVNYSWAFHAIDYLANTGVVSGTGNLIYSPGRSLSRADFILMLYRAYDMEKYASGDNFPDVPDTAYYADAVRAARAIGIATGDEKGNFNPSQTLTRQDAMVLLKRTLDRTGLQFTAGSLAGFSDSAQVADYAAEPVAALVQAGVIGGSEGKLSPSAAVTRAEMAVMLYRALHLQTDSGTAVYETVPSVRLVCIGSTIYPDVEIENYQAGTLYVGLYALEQMTRDEDGYAITLGASESIDDQIIWDGTNLSVNGQIVPVAAGCEAIAVDMYSKRTAGLCSTGGEYSVGAVSMVDGAVQTVYYKK